MASITAPFITACLKCLFTGVRLQDEVVSDANEPVAVVPLLVEAVSRRDEDVGREDGGCTHEVSFPRLPPEEETGQPGEGAFGGRRCPSTLLVRPDDPPSSCTLVRPVPAVTKPTLVCVLPRQGGTWRRGCGRCGRGAQTGVVDRVSSEELVVVVVKLLVSRSPVVVVSKLKIGNDSLCHNHNQSELLTRIALQMTV